MNSTILFILLSIANVVLSTIRSLATIKSGKYVASLVNAIYYGYYTIVAIYTVTLDFAIWQKVVICFFCNLVGVFVVKIFEEKMRKDRLWKVEMTVKNCYTENVVDFLKSVAIPYNYSYDETNRYTLFNIYCATQKQSESVKELVNKFNAKYFVSESKIL